MYRMGIIGTGIIGGVHIDAVNNLKNMKVSAVADINAESAKKASEMADCPYFTDYKKIDEPLDAVIINLPHYLHCEAACYFLEKGINVLVEKPMAVTYSECLSMMNSAEKTGAKLAVAHVQRFFEGNETVKRFYEEKTFGELAMTNERRNINYFVESRPKWFLKKELSGGGIFMNYGAHGLDRLMYIMGANVTEVHSNCRPLLQDYDVEGHAQVFLRFDNGVSSVMTFCGYPGFNENETTFYFTKGTVRFTFPDRIEIAVNGKFEPYEIKPDGSAFEKQLMEFSKLMDGVGSNIPSAEYGANIIKVIEQVYFPKKEISDTFKHLMTVQ